MLKYGHDEKMMFCVFIGHEGQNLFWGIFIFIRRVAPSNLVVVTSLLTSLRKDFFLRRRLKRYRLLMAEIADLMVFDIRLQASSRISMPNRFMYDGYNFSRTMQTVFTATSSLRTPVPLRKNM